MGGKGKCQHLAGDGSWWCIVACMGFWFCDLAVLYKVGKCRLWFYMLGSVIY
jgi:hypothetical protein